MLEGEISEIQLVARLVELWREQFTGAIRFENDGIIKIVYFKGGDILSASTNDRADSIDEILMRAGKVSREHVKQALAKRKENETLGDALLNLGFITRKELTWARRVQVVGVIRSIAAWTAGSFTIVEDYLPKRDEGTLFPLPQVLVELIVTDQDRATFERALDGGSAAFAKSHDFDEIFRRLGLNEDAEAIAGQIDGVKSAAEVAGSAHRDTFNAYKLIHALATLGILRRVEKAQAMSQSFEDDFASAGVADAAELWNPVEPQVIQQAEPSFELDLTAIGMRRKPAAPPTPPPVPEPEPPEPAAEPQPAYEEPMSSSPAETAGSAWDDDAELSIQEPAPAMPSWDLPLPVQPEPPPRIEPPVKPPAKTVESRWNAAEPAAEPLERTASKAPKSQGTQTATRKPVAKKPEKGGRYGLLVGLMVAAVLSVGGYYGWSWYQKRQSAEPETPATNTAAVKPPVQPPSTTTAPATTATETTATTPAVVASTAATETIAVPPPQPAPKPMQVTAPPVVTPQPPARVPSGGSDRYQQMAREFAASASGNFTVQVQILCEVSNLEKILRSGGSDIWFVPQPIGSRSCYRVLWGRYETREEAQRALAAIPADVRDRSSAVKPVPRPGG